jgi:hypothetical protein
MSKFLAGIVHLNIKHKLLFSVYKKERMRHYALRAGRLCEVMAHITAEGWATTA